MLDHLRGIENREPLAAPTIEQLQSREKEFEECFAEANVPTLLWLNKTRLEGRPASPGDYKDFLQGQNLPTIPELRKTDDTRWETLYDKKTNELHSLVSKPATAKEKLELDRAVLERRIMAGQVPPKTQEQELLPRFTRGPSLIRYFPQAPTTRGTYRINIPDHPGEFCEVILNSLAKKLWKNTDIRNVGFAAKTIGFVKRDALILYFDDQTINEAVKIIHADALENHYGFGEPTLFGQVIDNKIPGLTITTDPKNERGETTGTFGDTISFLMVDSLTQAMKEKGVTADKLIERLLNLDLDEWASAVLEPIFSAHAKKMFGKKYNPHNLAFIDKG